MFEITTNQRELFHHETPQTQEKVWYADDAGLVQHPTTDNRKRLDEFAAVSTGYAISIKVEIKGMSSDITLCMYEVLWQLALGQPYN